MAHYACASFCPNGCCFARRSAVLKQPSKGGVEFWEYTFPTRAWYFPDSAQEHRCANCCPLSQKAKFAYMKDSLTVVVSRVYDYANIPTCDPRTCQAEWLKLRSSVAPDGSQIAHVNRSSLLRLPLSVHRGSCDYCMAMSRLELSHHQPFEGIVVFRIRMREEDRKKVDAAALGFERRALRAGLRRWRWFTLRSRVSWVMRAMRDRKTLRKAFSLWRSSTERFRLVRKIRRLRKVVRKRDRRVRKRCSRKRLRVLRVFFSSWRDRTKSSAEKAEAKEVAVVQKCATRLQEFVSMLSLESKIAFFVYHFFVHFRSATQDWRSLSIDLRCSLEAVFDILLRSLEFFLSSLPLEDVTVDRYLATCSELAHPSIVTNFIVTLGTAINQLHKPLFVGEAINLLHMWREMAVRSITLMKKIKALIVVGIKFGRFSKSDKETFFANQDRLITGIFAKHMELSKGTSERIITEKAVQKWREAHSVPLFIPRLRAYEGKVRCVVSEWIRRGMPHGLIPNLNSATSSLLRQ